MRRNRAEVKKEEPLLLAGKREQPTQPSEEEMQNERAVSCCEQLGVLVFLIAILGAIFVLFGQPRLSESAAGTTGPVVHPVGSMGPANPTRGIFTGARELQFRFEFIKLANHKAKQKIAEEVLASFKADLDRLGEFLAKAQPGDSLSPKNQVVVAKEFEELRERLDEIEKSLVMD